MYGWLMSWIREQVLGLEERGRSYLCYFGCFFLFRLRKERRKAFEDKVRQTCFSYSSSAKGKYNKRYA